MATIPTRVETRLSNSIKRFQPVLASAKSRDVNESDTVIIVTDMLAEMFGYDKYAEITSEHAIRGTYCDLATKLGEQVQLLIEAKAIGLELKDAYVKQSVDYAANKGVEWVVLTNATNWRVYRVIFGKPIDCELVFEVDFMTLDPKKSDGLELLFVLTKEGWVKQGLQELHEQRQALNRFIVAAVTFSEPVLNCMRRELRRVCPNVKIQNEQIEQVLLTEVLKREVVEGEKADEARRKINRSINRQLRAKTGKSENTNVTGTPSVLPPTPPAEIAVSSSTQPNV
ncbi:MAG TPA: restriction endonuclease subunit R [Verrucomicrobiae bacterium]|nr:restriction endonuclease subunit R [Verrucomicrobiae bacterium]